MRPNLTDGTIAVRPWRAADVAIAHSMISGDPLVERFLSIPPKQTLEQTAAWYEKHAGFAERDEAYYVAIADAATDEFLGSSGIERSADDPAIGEIGYWLGAGSRGRGAASAAVRLLTAWGFEQGFERLQITVHEDNDASHRVALTCGYEREGTLRAWREQHGRRVDLVMYSRLAEQGSR